MLFYVKKRAKDISKTFLNTIYADRPLHLDSSLLSPNCVEELRVFATTVIRGTKEREITGFLLEIDWVHNNVKKRIPIPLDTGHPFWNSRGGNRGGRGIFVHNGILYVATALSVLKFDRDLNQVGEITHPYLAGLHEIYVDDDGIWLTATVHDLVVKIDFEGNVLDEWWGSESRVMQRYFEFSSRDLNLALDFPEETFVSEYEEYCKDEIFHINTVWSQNGKVYAFSSNKRSLIKIRPKPEKVVLQDGQLRSPHNGILTPDNRIIVNDTKNQCIRVYDLLGRRLKTLSTALGKRPIGGSMQFAQPGWQRGLSHVTDSIYLVGTSPATVFEVDIDKNIIGQVCRIDMDTRHCIHGLTVVTGF